jgi:ATP-dependent DNA helicase RecG
VRYPADTPLESVKGIGPVRARALSRLGLRTWGQLLTHFPSRHEEYPPPRPASELLLVPKASFEGTVRDIQTGILPGGLRKITARLGDSTGQVSASWLRAGFSGPRLMPGQRIAVSGNLVAYGRQVTFENPDWEPADQEPVHTRRLVPIYPLTSGVHLYSLRSLIHRALADLAPDLPEHLPEWLRSEARLPDLSWAVLQAHFPTSLETLAQAHRRLAFDELLLIQLVVLHRRQRWQEVGGQPLDISSAAIESLLEAQPFALTGAQRRVLSEILEDLRRPVPMSRLLQGEVGSGKTAVAAAALYGVAAAGKQGFIMAPTEILAEQHFRTISDFYARAGVRLAAAGYPIPRVALLTGSTSKRDKDSVRQALKAGEIDVLVGTHAVIQQGVEPRDLGLSVVDEQHRFGVRQRIDLRQKGTNPHLLVMTATPIPRTLALSLHGDLDLSYLDELPPGRQPIRTVLLMPLERAHAYTFIRREVSKGRQAFIICPLVEDLAVIEARAATEEYERLRDGELAGLRLALLHGRMRPAQKEEVMQRFRNGDFDVLVSTAVVEVGVDVPNATVMLIEGAERFGLAQLHQFRGRVGRGEHAATCLLLSDADGGEALERLETVARTADGLALAEYDLRTRGPGDFLGVRQSGLPGLRIATLGDVGLIELARDLARRLLEADSDLSRPEHAPLAARLAEHIHLVGEPN